MYGRRGRRSGGIIMPGGGAAAASNAFTTLANSLSSGQMVRMNAGTSAGNLANVAPAITKENYDYDFQLGGSENAFANDAAVASKMGYNGRLVGDFQGFAVDKANKCFYVPATGGHVYHGFNGIMKFDMVAGTWHLLTDTCGYLNTGNTSYTVPDASQTWTRTLNSEAADPNGFHVFPYSRPSGNAHYPSGTTDLFRAPPSMHTYCGPKVVTIGATTYLVVTGDALFNSPGTNGPGALWLVDLSNEDTETINALRWPQSSSDGYGRIASTTVRFNNMATCYESVSGNILITGSVSPGYHLYYLDTSDWTVKTKANLLNGAGKGDAPMWTRPDRTNSGKREAFFLQNNESNWVVWPQVDVYGHATTATAYRSVAYAVTPTNYADHMAAEYDEDNDTVMFWDGYKTLVPVDASDFSEGSTISLSGVSGSDDEPTKTTGFADGSPACDRLWYFPTEGVYVGVECFNPAVGSTRDDVGVFMMKP